MVCDCDRPGSSGGVEADPPGRPFALVACGDCGLVQQSPRFSDERIAALYDGDYYVFAEDAAARWARAVQEYVVHLAPLERLDIPSRRLLDVGCALGHLAALAARRGWRVTGIDVSVDATDRAKRQFGIDARGGELRELRNDLGMFDVVFLGDVIEHVPRPVEFMRDVHGVLTPRGTVCIDTPNWGGLWRRIGGRRWLGINRFHIQLFDAASMRRLLSAAGFGDVRMGSYTNCRYESWASRPEVQSVVNRLPGPLAWRANRLLARCEPRRRWSGLRRNPPGALDEATQAVDALCADGRATAGRGLRGDNLVAFAQRR